MEAATSLATRVATLARTARYLGVRRQHRPLAAGPCPRCGGRVELVTIGATGQGRYRQDGRQVGLCPACNCVFEHQALNRPHWPRERKDVD